MKTEMIIPARISIQKEKTVSLIQAKVSEPEMNKVEVKLNYRQLQIDVYSRLRNFAVSWQFETGLLIARKFNK